MVLSASICVFANSPSVTKYCTAVMLATRVTAKATITAHASATNGRRKRSMSTADCRGIQTSTILEWLRAKKDMIGSRSSVQSQKLGLMS